MSFIFKILVLSLLGQSNLAESVNAEKSVEFFDLFKSVQNEQMKIFFGTHIEHENRSIRGIRIAKKPQFINPGALARPSDVLNKNLKDFNIVKGSNNLKDSHDFKEITKPDIELKTVTAQANKQNVNKQNETISSSTAQAVTHATLLPSETTKMPLNESTTIFYLGTTKISNQSTTIFDGDLLNTIIKTGSTTIDEFFGRNVTMQSYEDYLSSNFTTTLAAKRFPKHKNDPYGVLDALETHTFPVMLMIALLLLVTVIMISSCVQMTLDTFLPRRTFPELPINKDEPHGYNNASFETKF